MPFTIVRQDITKMKVDAIVNAANSSLLMGGGVCGAIFKAAGKSELQSACDKLAPIETGQAVITSAFGLPSEYVIHTVGPIYHLQTPEQSEKLLTCAYHNSLELATKNKIESIAFPLISSGIYGYPKAEALLVARETIIKYLEHNDLDVYLTVFDKDAFSLSEKLVGDIDSYIDEHYVDEHSNKRRYRLECEELALDEASYKQMAPNIASSLDDSLEKLDEPFSETLLRLIDIKGKTDVEVYKKANIDRKLFSKIRTGKGYMPSKRTILALAISLELTLDETDDLLERAGYALSHSQKFDVIVEYFIVNEQYNIFEINEVLFKYDQALLGL